MNRLSRIAPLVAVAIVFSGTAVARADDSDQIEKASNLCDQADKWATLCAYQKALDCLAQAEKELQGVDETGKADTVAEIADKRSKITDAQKRWSGPSDVTPTLEGHIKSAEDAGDTGDAESCAQSLARVEAALADSWLVAHTTPEWRDGIQKKVNWVRKKVGSSTAKAAARGVSGMLGREFDDLERTLDNQKKAAAGYTSYEADFDAGVKKIEESLADQENQQKLGADGIAQFRKRLAEDKGDFAVALLASKYAGVDRGSTWIQDVLDGKNTHAYTSDVENQFKSCNEALDALPQDDPRTKKYRDQLAQQRKTFDSQQSQGDRDQAVGPAVKFWKDAQDYGKDDTGWENETTPPALDDFLNNAPPSLGCPKTQHYLTEVVQRWLTNDFVVKPALAKFPNDPELKKTAGEVKAVLEKAGGKMCSFANALLDQGEKLPLGKKRDSLVEHFYNLKVEINNATQGCSAHDALIARIDGLDKRFGQEKEQAAAAKDALRKKMIDAANAVWPDMVSSWKSKAKKLESAEAMKDIGSWKGTIVNFSGGGPGISWNRSGYSYYDSHWFILDVDGVPVAGDLDQGLADALANVEKTTGVQHEEAEEVVGIIDGLCKVTERVENPFNRNEMIEGRRLDAIRMRIVALKSVTVALACGKGTNLKKVDGQTDVDVPESGSSSSETGTTQGGHGSPVVGHMVHRLMAWFMCLLLAIAGALSLAHGAAKFVAPLQDAKAKLGDGLGYAGWGFTAIGAIWFLAAIGGWLIGMCEFGSLPSVAMFFAGIGLGLDLLRSKGKLKPETAGMIQPVSVLFGLGCFAAAMVHFLLWDKFLL